MTHVRLCKIIINYALKLSKKEFPGSILQQYIGNRKINRYTNKKTVISQVILLSKMSILRNECCIKNIMRGVCDD